MSIPAMWTVYERPRDYPDSFVARLFDERGQPTNSFITSTDLETLRRYLMHMGLVPLARHPDDDPVIVETWI